MNFDVPNHLEYRANVAMSQWLDRERVRESQEAVIRRVIVTRHPAAVQFIRQEHGLSDAVPVLASATVEDVRGAVVYGNLPLHLAALAHCVWAIEFAGEPPRGTEYTLEDMRAAGAKLRRYRVQGEAGGFALPSVQA